MTFHDDPTTQKLLNSLMQFRKAAVDMRTRSVSGCKPSEVRVLFCIQKNVTPENPLMKVSEISKLLQVTSPTITQLIKSLEAQGLVERTVDQADRRAVGIRLTAQGEAITKKAMGAFGERLHGLIAYLGEEESNRLAELLGKVTNYFNQREAGHDPLRERGGEEDV